MMCFMLRLLFITVVILVLSSDIYADTYKLTGRVVSNNKPIIGANIVVSNTKTGSITGKRARLPYQIFKREITH